MKLIEWSKFLFEWTVVAYFQGAWGKGLTIMSPSIFGVITSFNTYFLLNIKLIINGYFNKGWAGGNLFLLSDEVFGWVSWIFMQLDVYNIEAYQYALRPLRFLSFMISTLYVMAYTTLIISTYEEIWVKNEWEETDAKSFPDFFKGVALGYMSFNFLATYVVNLVIVIKEMTMDQLAWSKAEDFEAGEVEGLGWNIDLLYWFGISEDY